MTSLKTLIGLTGVAAFAMTAIGQTEVTSIAVNNGTIRADGPTGSPWFHNAQGAGDFASFAISTFTLTAAEFGEGEVTTIDAVTLSYTQANAGFTTDGPVEIFITFDEAAATDDYAALTFAGTASGIDDAQFTDSPSAQSLGTGTFTEVESGTVDVYTLDVSAVETELLAAINAGTAFSLILTATDENGAVTYAGIQNNTYADSIILSVTASMGGGEAGPSGLIITGVLDGPLPGGVPKVIELYALEDIADLSVYGIGSANNGGGTDGEELTLEGSASAGDFIWIASEDVEFANVFGFAPDYVTGAAAINGDDAVELFLNGEVVEVFGDINVDGNGEPWEYLDGWAYRNDETLSDGTFVLADWSFSGANALDNLDAAGVAAAVPFGTYQPPMVVEPEMLPWQADGLVPGDMVFSPWFGSFEYQADGWVKHGELGWLWMDFVVSSDSMWMYSLTWESWLWSQKGTFPTVYDAGSGKWVYYLILEGVGTFVYDYSTSQWTVSP